MYNSKVGFELLSAFERSWWMVGQVGQTGSGPITEVTSKTKNVKKIFEIAKDKVLREYGYTMVNPYLIDQYEILEK